MGELIFLDEYRFKADIEEEMESYDEMYNYALEAYENARREYYEPYDSNDYEQYYYLTSTDVATLTEDDIKVIISHLMKSSDFYQQKDNAHELIEEILAKREEEEDY
jgi:hypothetical protein